MGGLEVMAGVPVEDLFVDPSYQRTLDEKRVDRIASEFDPALLGTREVSARNGRSAVFDGQHRLAALRKIGRRSVPCIVHRELSA